jgi:hypothetical protein
MMCMLAAKNSLPVRRCVSLFTLPQLAWSAPAVAQNLRSGFAALFRESTLRQRTCFKFTDTLMFRQDLGAVPDSDNKSPKPITALTSKICGRPGKSRSDHRQAIAPLPEAKHTDIYSRLGLASDL